MPLSSLGLLKTYLVLLLPRISAPALPSKYARFFGVRFVIQVFLFTKAQGPRPGRDNIRKEPPSFVGMQVFCCFSVASFTGYAVG